MGILRKIFHVTPPEELEGIHLNTDGMFWELEGKTDFPAVLNALNYLLPKDSILYFEGGAPPVKLRIFLGTHSVPEQIHIAVGTIWPRPDYYHVPATRENLSTLAKLAEHIAGPELAIHFHVYHDSEILLEWYDAFDDPMSISGKMPENKVREFAKMLNMQMTKEKSES